MQNHQETQIYLVTDADQITKAPHGFNCLANEIQDANKRYEKESLSEAQDKILIEEMSDNELFRQIRNILNKLTPQSIQKLAFQLINLPINNEHRLKNLVSIIFEKAINEQIYTELYAQLSKVLSSNYLKIKVPSKVPNKYFYFRTLLLTQCQKQFDTNYRQEINYEKLVTEANECNDEQKKLKLKVLADEKLSEAKQRYFGNIRLIGELFKLGMLTEGIMNDCIQRWIKQDSNEEYIECLCRLLASIGKEIDKPHNALNVNKYFKRLEDVNKNESISFRIRLIVTNLLELRKNNWMPSSVIKNRETITPAVKTDIAANSINKVNQTEEQPIKNDLYKEQLLEVFKKYPTENDDNNVIVNELQAAFTNKIRKSPEFIYSLVHALCRSYFRNKIKWSLVRTRLPILNSFINQNKQSELEILNALQTFCFETIKRQKFISEIFEIIYTEQIVDMKTFKIWRYKQEHSFGLIRVTENFFKEFLKLNKQTSRLKEQPKPIQINMIKRMTDDKHFANSILDEPRDDLTRLVSNKSAHSEQSNKSDSIVSSSNTLSSSDWFNANSAQSVLYYSMPTETRHRKEHSAKECNEAGSQTCSRETSVSRRSLDSRENSPKRNSGIKDHEKKNKYTSDEIDLKVTSILEKLIQNMDSIEALNNCEQFKPVDFSQYAEFIELFIQKVLHLSDRTRNAIGVLFFNLIDKKKIDCIYFSNAFNNVLEMRERKAFRTARIVTYLSQIIAPLFQRDFTINFLSDFWEPIKLAPLCANLIAETLHNASSRLGQRSVVDIFKKSNLKLDEFLKDLDDPDENSRGFNAELKFIDSLTEFSINHYYLQYEYLHNLAESDCLMQNSVNGLKFDNLEAFLSNQNAYERKLSQIFEFTSFLNADFSKKIESEFDEIDFTSKEFIRSFVTAVCSCCMDENNKLDRIRFKNLSPLLTKFMNKNKEFELEGLFAIQALNLKMKHQPVFIRVLFNKFYNEDIVSEEIFWKWNKETHEEGHAMSVVSLKPFFELISDSEPNESSEYTVSSTNLCKTVNNISAMISNKIALTHNDFMLNDSKNESLNQKSQISDAASSTAKSFNTEMKQTNIHLNLASQENDNKLEFNSDSKSSKFSALAENSTFSLSPENEATLFQTTSLKPNLASSVQSKDVHIQPESELKPTKTRKTISYAELLNLNVFCQKKISTGMLRTKVGDLKKIDQKLQVATKVNNLLYTLSSQNVQKIGSEILKLPINNESLKEMVEIIFEKSITVHGSIQTYAQLCEILSDIKVPSNTDPDKQVNFRTQLLNRCQKEFENDFCQEINNGNVATDASECNDKQKNFESKESAEKMLKKVKQRWFNNILFIGELFKLGMLCEEIMNVCIESLIKQDSNEEYAKYLCRLLTTIGSVIDKPSNAEKMKSFFEGLESIIQTNKEDISVNLFLAIFNLLELRKTKWVAHKPQLEHLQPSNMKNYLYEDKLLKIFIKTSNQNDNNDVILNALNAAFNKTIRNSTEFISSLVHVMCRIYFKNEMRWRLIRKILPLLNSFINQNKQFELETIFAVEKFCFEVKKRQNSLGEIFKILFEKQIVNKKTFKIWRHKHEHEHCLLRSTEDFFKNFLKLNNQE